MFTLAYCISSFLFCITFVIPQFLIFFFILFFLVLILHVLFLLVLIFSICIIFIVFLFFLTLPNLLDRLKLYLMKAFTLTCLRITNTFCITSTFTLVRICIQVRIGTIWILMFVFSYFYAYILYRFVYWSVSWSW